jgi:hypothetical protein
VRRPGVDAGALARLHPRRRRAGRHRRLDVELGGQRPDLDDHRVDAVGGGGLALGDHERHRLAGEDDLFTRQRLAHAPSDAVDDRQVGRGEYRNHPGHGQRRLAVDALDPPVRLGGEHEPGMEQTVHRKVARVARRPAHLALAVDPPARLTDGH